jgi:serine/threonine protein kinase
MALPKLLSNRYEIKTRLSKTGMSEVYQAYDTRMGCDVAVKVMLDLPDPKARELFEKEWKVLAGWDAPNVVTIFDRGNYQQEGVSRPFFVMPLLRGSTLADLIANSSGRLTVERSVHIITQACRGLQAAHDRGLVHRDLKPSNIFVMEDDSVKVIDFGVVHLVDRQTTRIPIGTLLYMSPEQIEMKALSRLSDIFSMGVVCYETLTGRRPFDRHSEAEISEAILRQIPPPASEYNPAVNEALSRVIHKSMAKQPWHRFSSAREFADTLGKALRGEPIELFDPARIQPRIRTSRKAYEQNDYQFAAEILNELEAEGNLDPDILSLRRQINWAIQQKTIAQLLESARTRFEEDEYFLALEKIHQVLELDPENAPAHGLKTDIDKKNKQRKIEDWMRLAHQHISNFDYGHAHEALENVLKLSPQDAGALQLLEEVEHQAEEYQRQRQEKHKVFKAAQEAWAKGELGTALNKMEVVLDLDRQAPDTTSPAGSAPYQNFYNKIRSEHEAINNACNEARICVKERRFDEALAICDEYLAKYPGQALLEALKLDVEEQQRQALSEFIAETDRRVESEADLEKRVNILREARDRHPGEAHFEKALRLTKEKRDLVNAIAAKARFYEDKSQFSEALGQWEILGTIYPSYPGLNVEVERVVKRRDQQARNAARARWVEAIDRNLQSRDYTRALETCKRALEEFSDDPELGELEKQARVGVELQARVRALVADGQELFVQQRYEEGLEALRNAHRLDDRSRLARNVLTDALAERGQTLLEKDWRAAEILIDEALTMDAGHALAKSLRTLLGDRKQREFIDQMIASARQMQAAGNLEGAMAEVGRGLAAYPDEPRLSQWRQTLAAEALEIQRQQARQRDLDEARTLARNSEATDNEASIRESYERVQTLTRGYKDDRDFQTLDSAIQRRLEATRLLSKTETQVKVPEQPPERSSEPVQTPESVEKPSERSGGFSIKAWLRQAFSWPATSRVRTEPSVREKSDVAVSKGARPGPSRQNVSQTLQSSLRSIRSLMRTALDWVKSLPLKTETPAEVAGKPAAPTGSPEEVATQSTRQAGTHPLALATKLGRDVIEWARKPVRVVGFAVPRAALGAAGAVVLILCGVVVWKWTQPPPPPPAVELELKTSPPGATLLVDGKEVGVSPRHVTLATGTHKIEARKEGFRPWPGNLTIKDGSSNPFNPTLVPLATALRISTNQQAPQISLDGQPAGEIKDGVFTLESLDMGKHTLRVFEQHTDATIAFEAKPGAMPVLTENIQQKDLKVVAVSTLGSHSRVQFTFNPGSFAVDGVQKGEVGPEGLGLNDLPRGTHQLNWGEGKEQGTFQFELGDNPAMMVHLISDRPVGSLVVHVDQDDVEVFVDGKTKGKTTKGTRTVSNLSTTQHVVTVVKDGYHSEPDSKTVNVVKGGEITADFRLLANPSPPLQPNPREVLTKQATEAFNNHHYVLPEGQNAVYYLKQLCEHDPNDAWAKEELELSIQGAVHEADVAINHCDFNGPKEVDGALLQLLPDRKEGKSLREDIRYREVDCNPPPKPETPTVFNIRVRHKHRGKNYCEGILKVSDHTLTYHAESASKGSLDRLEIPCSALPEIKLQKDGFEMEVAGKKWQFEPTNPSEFNIAALKTACGK